MMDSFYIDQIKKYSLLTKQEEKDLILDYYHTKNIKSLHKLVESNLRFVLTISNKYVGYGFSDIDLLQEGTIGLMHAIKKFDPYMNNRLVTYAKHWIDQHIKSYVTAHWGMVKINTSMSMRTLFYDPDAEKHKSEFSEGEINQAKMLKQRDVYLNEYVYDSDMELMDFIKSKSKPADEILMKQQQYNELYTTITSAMDLLNERERFIIYNRGYSDTHITLVALGELLNISPVRVKHIETNGMRKLKKILSGRKGIMRYCDNGN